MTPRRFSFSLSPSEALQLFLLLLYYFIYGYNPRFVFDDAYFFVRYAENILAGHGYTWNAGEAPVDGLSSPLWLLVVLAALLVVPTEFAHGGLLNLLSTGFALLALLMLFYLTRFFLPEKAQVFAILAPLTVVLTDLNIVVAGQSGMETALACSLLMGFFGLLAWRFPAGDYSGFTLKWSAILGVYSFALLLVRPEFGLIACGCPLLLWLNLVLKKQPGHWGALWWGEIAGALIAIYVYARLQVFGDILPLSFYIKSTLWTTPYALFDERELANLRSYPFFYLRESVFLHLLLMIGLAQNGLWKRYAWLWVPLYATQFYLSTTLQIMGYLHRYYVPLACGQIILTAIVYGELFSKNAVETFPNLNREAFNRGVFWCSVLCITCALFLPGTQLRTLSERTGNYRVSHYIRNFPEGTTIACTESGIVAAQNPKLNFIDLAGLNTREFSHGFNVNQLYAMKPDVITLVHFHYGQITSHIQRHPTFQEYEPLKLFDPHATEKKLDNCLFVWKNSPRYALIRQALMTAKLPPEKN